MLIELPSAGNDYKTVWDKPTPVIKVNEKLYRVYLLEEIGAPLDYAEIVELLEDLDESCTVEFHINTPGGVLDTAVMLMDAINRTEARTVGRLSGTVASAGTMIALTLDELVIAPYTSFMIHAWSVTGQAGKANEIEAQNKFMQKETKELFNSVYERLLTPREIGKVLKGTDIWLNDKEVQERLRK